jgi:hypothetical protein
VTVTTISDTPVSHFPNTGAFLWTRYPAFKRYYAKGINPTGWETTWMAFWFFSPDDNTHGFVVVSQENEKGRTRARNELQAEQISRDKARYVFGIL